MDVKNSSEGVLWVPQDLKSAEVRAQAELA